MTPERAEEYAAWLRLVFFSGLTRAQCRRTLEAFALPQDIFNATQSQLSKVLPQAQITRLRQFDAADAQAVAAAIQWLEAPEHYLVTLADAHYPHTLLELPDPPLVLFALGQIDALNRSAIAIVGSRNATAQGVRDTEDLSCALVNAGQIVISGLAEGIDAAAHRGALKASGAITTIAVIGTGIDLVYPARHRELAHAIAQRGLIVSEFMLQSRALAYHFPQRNRIISGLARGVVVMEAALKSGSLITARLAAEQGRDVFAVPGSIHSPLARGCHALIRQGAKLVETATDVLEELKLLAPALPADVATPAMPSTAPDALPAIAPALAKIGFAPFDFETALQQTQLDAAGLSACLLEWELAGAIQRLAGGNYQRIR